MILATKSYCREYAEKISTGCEFLSGIGNTDLLARQHFSKDLQKENKFKKMHNDV